MAEPTQPRSSREVPRVLKVEGVPVTFFYDEEAKSWAFSSEHPKVEGKTATLKEAEGRAAELIALSMQRTEHGLEIPVPARGEFYGNLSKTVKRAKSK